MNASTVSRQINSRVPSLKDKYIVTKIENKIIVVVADFATQLKIEEAAKSFGYMCSDLANGFEVC